MPGTRLRLSALLLGALLLPQHAIARATSGIDTIAATERIHMLVGRGGNVAVVDGEDGMFVVDDQYASGFAAIEAAIRAISPAPIRFLVNTHWHSDHSDANVIHTGDVFFNKRYPFIDTGSGGSIDIKRVTVR